MAMHKSQLLMQLVAAANSSKTDYISMQKVDFQIATTTHFVCSCNILSPPISHAFMFFNFEVGFMLFLFLF